MKTNIFAGLTLASVMFGAVLYNSPAEAMTPQERGQEYRENIQEKRNEADGIREDIEESRGEMKQLRDETQENIQQRKEESEQKMEQNREEFQEKRSVAAKSALNNHAERLQHRFVEVYDVRLTEMITKIDTRLDIMEEEGKDVTAARAKIDEANVQLASATATAQSAITSFETIDTETENAREISLEAKDIAEKARVEYKLALELAKEAVQLAKAL